MESEFETSRIEQKKRGLYDPDEGPEYHHDVELTPAKVDVSHDWEDTSIVSDRDRPQKSYGAMLLKMLLVFAVIATFASGGFVLYQLFNPFAKPSDKNILVAIDLPPSVSPGAIEDIRIRVSNQNRVALQYANLILTYPSGSKDPDETGKDLRDEKKLFGTVAPGEVVEFRTKAIFLGQENTDKEFRATLEYRFENISSVFEKHETRTLHMLASPINLTVDMLKEINSGQQVDLNVRAVSNTVIPLGNVMVKIDYPLGFTFTGADPKPTVGNNIWRIGAVDPTQALAIKVRGVLSGNYNEEKVFYTTIGAAVDKNSREINAEYSRVLSSITLQRPFIGIGLSINDKSAADATAHFGEIISGRINWSNNLSKRITNAQIQIKLKGVALDRASVGTGNGGYYRSSDNTITWDSRGDKTLAQLEDGDTGVVTFSFKPLPPVSAGAVLTNPVITAEVTIRGQRMSESGVPEEVVQFLSQDVRVTSQAQFAARVVYNGSRLTNSGPLPPVVDKETTYTIILSIVNTANKITDASVRGIIPAGVEWNNVVYPGNEPISYDPINHLIVWSPGDIPSGTGVGSTPPRSVEFQIAFIPSLGQVHSTPKLFTDIEFTGQDTFTREQLFVDGNELSTVLTTDSSAGNGSAEVVAQ